jgi:hypothetical protein
MRNLIAAAACSIVLAACSTGASFVYRPSPAQEAGTRLPLQVAVLPFPDGNGATAAGGKRPVDPGRLDITKVGLFGMIDPVTPEAFAEAFADELAASGRFRAVRFVHEAGELPDADIRVEVAVEKASIAASGNMSSEIAIRFRALRGAERQPAWEHIVARRWTDPPDLYAECARANLKPELAVRCYADRMHERLNEEMRALFSDAGGMLAAALGEHPEGDETGGGEPKPGRPAQSPESDDDLVERILKESR